MDKSVRVNADQSMQALLSAPFRNKKHNPPFSPFSLSPFGESSPRFTRFLPFLHPCAPSFFLTLKDPTFSVSLRSHTTDEMTHGGEDREAFCCMAWNWIPMTSPAWCNTRQSKRLGFHYTWWVLNRDFIIQWWWNEFTVSLLSHINNSKSSKMLRLLLDYNPTGFVENSRNDEEESENRYIHCKEWG